MPDLHDLFDHSVGSVGPFDLAALARRRRRRRRQQVATLAGVVAVLAAVSGAFALNQSDDHGVAIRTHREPTSAAPSTTGAPVSTTTAPFETVVPNRSAPQPGDFTGEVTVSRTTIAVGDDQGVRVDLHIRNATDHTINVAYALEPTSTGLMCATLDAQGRPTKPLASSSDFVSVSNPPLAPGDDGGTQFVFQPRPDDVGTITCEAIIVRSPDHHIVFVARMTNIAPVTITVTAPETAPTS